MNEKGNIKNKLLFILSLLIVLAIGIYIGFALSNKSINNMETDKQGIDNNTDNVNNKEDDIALEDNNVAVTDNQTNKEEDTTNDNKEYDNAITAIKKCLKDSSWVKDNLYVKESEKIGDEDISDQIINFMVCKGDKIPVVMLYVSSENVRFHKVILVAYVNDAVKAEIVNQGHIYHGGFGIDPNKNVVVSGFMHMGYNSTAVQKITNGKVTVLGAYGTEEVYDGENLSYKYTIDDGTGNNLNKEVTEDEYNEYKDKLNVEQYNTFGVNTPLTDDNVDLYIK